jgi:hypothetical protein
MFPEEASITSQGLGHDEFLNLTLRRRYNPPSPNRKE